MVEIDGEVLAGVHGSGAVVPVEMDVRRLMQGPEAIAKGLDASFGAIGEFIQRAQIEVEVRGHRHGPFTNAAMARGLFACLPVEVDAHDA